MGKNTKYSVLMSVYWKENPVWLKKALDSVLYQTVCPTEIVLVKDGSLTAELDSVIDIYRNKCNNLIVVALDRNRGLGLALQEGLNHCSNELIARMDSDDISVPERCEKQLIAFEQNPRLDIVGCWENEFLDNSEENIFSCHRVPETHQEIRKYMRRRCALLHPTVMFKKEAVLRAGNYQHRLLFEDYDLFVRMLQTGAVAYNIQESLYYLRVNSKLFERRGGFRYAKALFKFRYGMWQSGFSSLLDFVVSGFGQFFVCMLPNKMRKTFYKLFLR